ncbi:hypothetical protein ACFXKO_22110, partial [Streptomyces sp. NPDC059209]
DQGLTALALGPPWPRGLREAGAPAAFWLGPRAASGMPGRPDRRVKAGAVPLGRLGHHLVSDAVRHNHPGGTGPVHGGVGRAGARRRGEHAGGPKARVVLLSCP